MSHLPIIGEMAVRFFVIAAATVIGLSAPANAGTVLWQGSSTIADAEYPQLRISRGGDFPWLLRAGGSDQDRKVRFVITYDAPLGYYDISSVIGVVYHWYDSDGNEWGGNDALGAGPPVEIQQVTGALQGSFTIPGAWIEYGSGMFAETRYGYGGDIEGQLLFQGIGRPINWTLTLEAVPEPATWAMMITGFGLLGTSFRRRRAATSNRNQEAIPAIA